MADLRSQQTTAMSCPHMVAWQVLPVYAFMLNWDSIVRASAAKTFRQIVLLLKQNITFVYMQQLALTTPVMLSRVSRPT